mgnify:CR=1 FL=1
MIRILIISLSLLSALLVVELTEASQNMEGLVREHLLIHYNSEEIRIEGLKYPDILPEEVSEIETEKRPDGLTLINFKLKNGKTIKTTAKVIPLSRVIVAKDFLKKGHLLKEENLEFCFVEKGRIPHDAFRDTGELVGLILTRAIAKGTILTPQMVTKDQVIKKGSRVMIVIETPGFRISIPGELLKSTKLGEPAKAINLQTKKIVSGILLDKETLMVEF